VPKESTTTIVVHVGISVGMSGQEELRVMRVAQELSCGLGRLRRRLNSGRRGSMMGNRSRSGCRGRSASDRVGRDTLHVGVHEIAFLTESVNSKGVGHPVTFDIENEREPMLSGLAWLVLEAITGSLDSPCLGTSQVLVWVVIRGDQGAGINQRASATAAASASTKASATTSSTAITRPWRTGARVACLPSLVILLDKSGIGRFRALLAGVAFFTAVPTD